MIADDYKAMAARLRGADLVEPMRPAPVDKPLESREFVTGQRNSDGSYDLVDVTSY